MPSFLCSQPLLSFIDVFLLKSYRETFDMWETWRKKINSRDRKKLSDNDLMCFSCFIENFIFQFNFYMSYVSKYFIVWLIYWFVKSFLRASGLHVGLSWVYFSFRAAANSLRAHREFSKFIHQTPNDEEQKNRLKNDFIINEKLIYLNVFHLSRRAGPVWGD